MTEQPLSAAEEYRQSIKDIEPEIVTVTVWSGAKMTRIAPTAYGSIFETPTISMPLADAAVTAWEEDGLDTGAKSDDAEVTAAQLKELEKLKTAAGVKAINAKQRVFDNSVKPKIVDRKPRNGSEIHWSQLHPQDLAWLYQYEASGGSDAVRAAMFLGNVVESSGLTQRPLVGAAPGIDGKGLQQERKRASRHKK